MYTIRNSNTGQQTTCKNKAHLIRVLRNIVAFYGGRAALQGIYVDKAGERDPYNAADFDLH